MTTEPTGQREALDTRQAGTARAATVAMFSGIGSIGNGAYRGPQVCYSPNDGGAPPPAAPAAPAAPPAAAPPAAPPAAPAAPQAFTAPWEPGQPYVIGDKPWWEGIAEQPVKDLMAAKNYANPYELAMAYHNANKLVSGAADAVIIPGADATPEQWDAFHKKMGRPDTPDGYDIKVPDGVQADPRMVDFGKKLAHELGLPPSAAQKMSDKWNDFVGNYNNVVAEEMRAQNDADVASMQQRWGADLDANLSAGKRVVQALSAQAQSMGMPADHVANVIAKAEAHMGTAGVVELLALIGRSTGEGQFKGAANGVGDPNNPDTMSPQQAQAEAQRLMHLPEYTDKNHANHKPTVDKVQRLFARM